MENKRIPSVTGWREDIAMIVEGIVERGKQLGRTIGFPTANIRPDRIVGKWPDNGVYIAAFWMEGEEKARPCMLNQGVHPTVPDGKPTIECYLLDFSGDIYGLQVRVEYLRYIRPEKQFENLDALKAQLNRDCMTTRQWILDEVALKHPEEMPETAIRAGLIQWQMEGLENGHS